jgi:hypothetical protein
MKKRQHQKDTAKRHLEHKTKSIKQKRDFDQGTLTEVEEGSVQLTSLYELV